MHVERIERSPDKTLGPIVNTVLERGHIPKEFEEGPSEIASKTVGKSTRGISMNKLYVGTKHPRPPRFATTIK